MRKLPTSRKVVALMVNACSECVQYTDLVLDTLKANGIKANFGITGEWAEAHPELLRRIVDEGHTLVNHGYSHRSFTGLSTNTPLLDREERVEELRKADAAFRRAAGANAKPYFIPPYEEYDVSVLRDVGALGYSCNIMPTVFTAGPRGLSQEQILQRVLDGLEPGAIYLLHLGSQSQDGPALPAIISKLRYRGYDFATVDEYCPRP